MTVNLCSNQSFVKLYSQLAKSTSNKNRASSLHKIQIQIRSALNTNQPQNQLCLVAQNKNCRKFQKQNSKKKKKKKKISLKFQQLFNLSFSSQIIFFLRKKKTNKQKKNIGSTTSIFHLNFPDNQTVANKRNK
ncbi:hypothetical protein ACJW30_05G033000 [Castanea mollissima]